MTVLLAATFTILLLPISLALGYLYFLILASIRRSSAPIPDRPVHTFAIAIPAPNGEVVIGTTVDHLLRLDYPRDMYDIHVASDNSTDRTVEVVRGRRGRIVTGRQELRLALTSADPEPAGGMRA